MLNWLWFLILLVMICSKQSYILIVKHFLVVILHNFCCSLSACFFIRYSDFWIVWYVTGNNKIWNQRNRSWNCESGLVLLYFYNWNYYFIYLCNNFWTFSNVYGVVLIAFLPFLKRYLFQSRIWNTGYQRNSCIWACILKMSFHWNSFNWIWASV